MSFPALFAHFSGPLKLILESGIFLAAFTAVVLNLLLNGTSSNESRNESNSDAVEAPTDTANGAAQSV